MRSQNSIPKDHISDEKVYPKLEFINTSGEV
jgi:hypothetical protein